MGEVGQGGSWSQGSNARHLDCHVLGGRWHGEGLSAIGGRLGGVVGCWGSCGWCGMVDIGFGQGGSWMQGSNARNLDCHVLGGKLYGEGVSAIGESVGGVVVGWGSGGSVGWCGMVYDVNRRR